MRRVLVVHGPNLNLLGTREPDVYGDTTLDELDGLVSDWGRAKGLDVAVFQSNHEGAIIDRLHQAVGRADGVVINPGAFTHYSYAIHDAIQAIDLPTVEVHISNIKAREDWRRHSVVAPACEYSLYGRGIEGYDWALRRLIHATSVPSERIGYGPEPDQIGELRMPEGSGPFPVAVLYHGGGWRDEWTRDLMDGLATGLPGRGIATWNAEFRRVGSGGGWPTTLDDAAVALDALATLAKRRPLDLARITTVGHGAGGQLALWVAVRPPLHDDQTPVERPVAPARVAALSPMTDLVESHSRDGARGTVEGFLRRTPETGPERFAASSPLKLLPIGVEQLIIHGSADRAVSIDLSAAYVRAARESGDTVELVDLDGGAHNSPIDDFGAHWETVLDHVTAFALG